MQLVSFDIFDTTLFRKCGVPENIFYLTALSLFGDDSSKVDYYLFWRKQAESKSYQMLKERHLSLEQIYHSYEQDYFGIERYVAIEMEKQIESENLCVNPSVKSIIDKSRQEGKKICFISDMYLDANFIIDILARECCYNSGDKIYISNEYKKSKAHKGELYDIVKKELKPSKWHHYGDNRHSDIKQARRRGIKAIFVNSSFNQVEESAIKQSRLNSNSREYSLLIGWMRWMRLSNGDDSKAEIAANFVAPLYISYVQFVLESAKEKGIKQLYFLNRDSYILYEIAKEIGCLDIELHYLYVSRKSLVLPAIKELTDKDLLNVFDQKTLVRKDIDEVLACIKTNRTELASYGIEFSFNKIASSKQEREVLDKILRSEFTTVLKERIAKDKILLCDYLKQEGVTNDAKSAFVDVGWLGSTRLMINKILRSEGYNSVDFFYLGVRKDVLPMKYGKFYSFIKEPVTGLTALIENYFSVSPYTTVTAYYRDGDKVYPRLKDGYISDSMQNILETNLGVSMQMIKQIKTFNPLSITTLRDVSNFMLYKLSDFKLKIDAEALTYVDFYDSPSNNNKMAFVKKMNLIELFRFSVLGERITAVDKISVIFTLGVRLASKVIGANDFVCRVKRALLKLTIR